MKNLIDKLNCEVWATLAPSRIHGVGVFAIRNIPKGTFLNSGFGENIVINMDEKHFEMIAEPVRNKILDEQIFYSDTNLLTFRHPNFCCWFESFMNHSDTPNSDGKITLRDITCGEEITENFKRIGLEIHRFTKNRMPFLEK